MLSIYLINEAMFMKKRYKMSKRSSRKAFRKGSKTNNKNRVRSSRGGTRL